MTRQSADSIFWRSLFAIGFEALFFLVLSFQPGWANGWPGIAQAAVYAGFVTLCLCVALLMSVGLLAPLCCRIGERWRSKNIGWVCFGAAYFLTFVACAFMAIPVFDRVKQAW